MTKKELVAKIAKEQNLDPKKLERMNMEQLKKMDLVVADESDLLGDSELPTNPGSDQDGIQTSGNGAVDSSEHSGGPTSDHKLPESGTQVLGEVAGMNPAISETPKSTDTVETQEGSDTLGSGADDVVTERVLIGYHPVTEAPVYSDEQ